MSRNTLVMLSFGAVLVSIALAPTASLAQFPPPPPMAAMGPPPVPAGGAPGLGGPPPIGAGGGMRAGAPGPGPRLGAAAGPRGNFAAVGASRRALVTGRVSSGGYGRWGGRSYHGYRAAYVAGAYAAGAYAGHGYGRSRYGYSDDCYYVYGRHRRVLVCD
ncbi:hypothetical protein E4K64_14625 [Bradyrhizobium frederickii]|uniref:Uncharacterized protein n=1 Tax=Bradyrhizobium frederickii TaxID=2560054 RepID=A0A4Y9P8K4_9BRAD|nr:hypothetical protein [Bradyrhizobium frederickii]TFV75822.1 hypothetical protein E4K64_14625 [Bradyrhizobium frederickii]